jgi:transcriptional regulator of heat shock response
MKERQTQLLSSLVEQYIETGRPVGSATLAELLGLSISSATIRTDLQELDQLNYVYQPHTSAGRVPTDHGYRYYVDHVVAAALARAEQQHIRQAFENLYREYRQWPRTATKLLASLAHTVVVAAAITSPDVEEAGMSELLGQLDQNELDTAREISTIVEAIDRQAANLARRLPADSIIFIGEENPLLPARYTSLIVRKAMLPGGQTALLMVAGPKRMSYQRNRALLDCVVELA